jgi:hypothetical protein
MHVTFPDLGNNDALAETKLSKLGVRWDKLSGDLFGNIVIKNNNQKIIAYLIYSIYYLLELMYLGNLAIVELLKFRCVRQIGSRNHS